MGIKWKLLTWGSRICCSFIGLCCYCCCFLFWCQKRGFRHFDLKNERLIQFKSSRPARSVAQHSIWNQQGTQIGPLEAWEYGPALRLRLCTDRSPTTPDSQEWFEVCILTGLTLLSVCFKMFPQRWQLTEARFPHLLSLVKVGRVSMLAFKANFRTARGRFHIKDFHVLLSLFACNKPSGPCSILFISKNPPNFLPTFGIVLACGGVSSTFSGCGVACSTIESGCSDKSRSPGGVYKGLSDGRGSCGWVSLMTKGVSSTAKFLTAGSEDDKIDPAISATWTEMADFLFHPFSCWILAHTVVWTVLISHIKALCPESGSPCTKVRHSSHPYPTQNAQAGRNHSEAYLAKTWGTYGWEHQALRGPNW